MANSVYIAASLDGYIATREDSLDWLTKIPNPTNDDYGYAEFINKIDAIVMGRGTFEKVLSFEKWPYDKFTFILSDTLKSFPNELLGKAEIINGDLNVVLGNLHVRGFMNLYIDGGKTIQGFLTEDLIDEMIITQIPVVLGSGIPLFGFLPKPMWFSHQKTEIHGELVQTTYSRVRGKL